VCSEQRILSIACNEALGVWAARISWGWPSERSGVDEFRAVVFLRSRKVRIKMDLAKLWNSLRGNRTFITVYSTFDGILVAQFFDKYTTGQWEWNVKGIVQMIGASVLLTLFALYHLQVPPPAITQRAK
jgi:hypothetical protein